VIKHGMAEAWAPERWVEGLLAPASLLVKASINDGERGLKSGCELNKGALTERDYMYLFTNLASLAVPRSCQPTQPNPIAPVEPVVAENSTRLTGRLMVEQAWEYLY
jgi:hypothetical protein